MIRLNCANYLTVRLHHVVRGRAVLNLLVCQYQDTDYHGNCHTHGRKCASTSAGGALLGTGYISFVSRPLCKLRMLTYHLMQSTTYWNTRTVTTKVPTTTTFDHTVTKDYTTTKVSRSVHSPPSTYPLAPRLTFSTCLRTLPKPS